MLIFFVFSSIPGRAGQVRVNQSVHGAGAGAAAGAGSGQPPPPRTGATRPGLGRKEAT
jgi:hypothetical protein